ncbi:recombinase family protein [Bacteroidia bacterium]|nr:recombinase family protein [Bacteroidia bacterium]
MGKKIAYYMRTSHYLQSIGTQEAKIEKGWKVYRDQGVSGRVEFENRAAAKKLLQDIKEGRISIVKTMRLERLGRSVKDLIGTIDTIHSYGIPIQFISEGITTLDENGKQTPTTGLLINVLSSLSEFFYHQNREKTLAGIALAREKKGKYVGRKPNSVETVEKYLNKPKTKKMIELLNQGNSVRSIVRVLECSPNSVYKLKKILNEN